MPLPASRKVGQYIEPHVVSCTLNPVNPSSNLDGTFTFPTLLDNTEYVVVISCTLIFAESEEIIF